MDSNTARPVLTAVLSGLFVLWRLASVIAAEGPATVTLDQALKTDPLDLARGYLVVNTQLSNAQVAGMGLTIRTSVDGKPQTIDKSNYQTFVSGYEERLRIYSQAISQRGFAQIGGTYAMAVGAACKQLAGLENGAAVIKQDGFQFQWETGIYQGKVALRGVVVESGIAVTSKIGSFDVRGKVSNGVIELRSMPSSGVNVRSLHLSGPQESSSCSITLTPN